MLHHRLNVSRAGMLPALLIAATAGLPMTATAAADPAASGQFSAACVKVDITPDVDVYFLTLALLDFGISAITLAWIWNNSSRMSPKVA